MPTLALIGHVGSNVSLQHGGWSGECKVGYGNLPEHGSSPMNGQSAILYSLCFGFCLFVLFFYSLGFVRVLKVSK